MEYRYLQHDGFIFRQPVPEEGEDTFIKIQIWTGRKWAKPMNADIALTPTVYGMEIPEAQALRQVDADLTRLAAEGRA